MHQDYDNRTGFICGLLGGTTKFLLDVPTNFPLRFSEAVIIAFVSGVAGVLGKHLVTRLLKIKKDEEK